MYFVINLLIYILYGLKIRSCANLPPIKNRIFATQFQVIKSQMKFSFKKLNIKSKCLKTKCNHGIFTVNHLDASFIMRKGNVYKVEPKTDLTETALLLWISMQTRALLSNVSNWKTSVLLGFEKRTLNNNIFNSNTSAF